MLLRISKASDVKKTSTVKNIQADCYNDDPKPEYAPKKNKINNPPAANPPIVATIQSGTRPASLIRTISLKYYFNN